MIELQVVGHPAVLDRVLHELSESGARMAEPGEFTLRRMLAGKVDLTEAEGIHATIVAEGEAQLRAATALRRGELGRFAFSLTDRLADLLALVEAGIDFTDEQDVHPISPGDLAAGLRGVDRELSELMSRCRSWAELSRMPRAVLVGPPSCGKSTLFNALLGRDRAVVDRTPGTTRDVLREPMSLRGREGQTLDVMLIDLAGLDDPVTALDEQIQAAARDAIDSADLRIVVDDGRGGAGQMNEPLLCVRTMTDVHPPTSDDQAIAVCAPRGEGLDALRQAIAARLAAPDAGQSAESLALQPRHEQRLRQARQHVESALELVDALPEGATLTHVEVVAAAVRGALDELCDLGGSVTPDDVIGRIFSKFCIGK